MRILIGYSYFYCILNVRYWIEMYATRLRKAGFEVDTFYLTLNPPGPALDWNQLDERWKKRDPDLMRMYDALAARMENYDVFLNWSGINIHPEFLPKFHGFKAFGCFDDPENSHNLSKPCAAAYDACFVGNIAEVETYRSWGVKHAEWWPMGFRRDSYDPMLTKDDILNRERPIDVAMVCDRVLPWRIPKLDEYERGVPQGTYYGNGWPRGMLDLSHLILLYQRTRIGPNIHHSSGPINLRTFALPANGVMQICDNASHLAKIFELDKECVGFESISEAIEKTHYYIKHEDERRRIAAAGFERCLRDYNEVAIFKRVVDSIGKLRPELAEKSK